MTSRFKKFVGMCLLAVTLLAGVGAAFHSESRADENLVPSGIEIAQLGLADAFEKAVNGYHILFTELEKLPEGNKSGDYLVKYTTYKPENPQHVRWAEEKRIHDPDILLMWPYRKIRVVVDDRDLAGSTKEHERLRTEIETALKEISESAKAAASLEITWSFELGDTPSVSVPSNSPQTISLIFMAGHFEPMQQGSRALQGPSENFMPQSEFEFFLKNNNGTLKVNPDGRILFARCFSYYYEEKRSPIYDSTKNCVYAALGLPGVEDHGAPSLLKALYSKDMESVPTKQRAIELIRASEGRSK